MEDSIKGLMEVQVDNIHSLSFHLPGQSFHCRNLSLVKHDFLLVTEALGTTADDFVILNVPGNGTRTYCSITFPKIQVWLTSLSFSRSSFFALLENGGVTFSFL